MKPLRQRISPENRFDNVTDQQQKHAEKPFVFRRTDMDALADVLIDEINAETGACDLFHRTRIIVPNRSIQRYLFLRFAHRHGIAAQLEFPSLMSVFQRFLPRGDERPNINEKTIGWRVYRILRDPETETKFPSLARWINGDSKRLYDLSRQLGELYNKYMLYRPWWINDWEAGRVPPGLNREPDALRQGELWRLIAGQDWRGNHFAAVYEKLVPSALRGFPSSRGSDDAFGVLECGPDGVSGAEDFPREHVFAGETIRIFGFSQLAPAVFQCLEEINRSGATVKLYHLVPSGEFYEDCRTRKEELREFLNKYFHEGQDPLLLQNDMNNLYFQHNPLLASFAMQNRVLLNGTSEWIDDADYACPDEEDRSGDATILHKLQKRIRDDRKPADARPEKQAAGSGCRTVQIRNCYSAFREVEAAHNFVLHCLNEDRDLQLKDIFIMSPTPADYAPLVDAVFNHSDGAPQIGASISDQPQTERLPAYGTLMKILALFKGDFTASEIFGILQEKAIQDQWGITPDDCQYCLTRAMQAGIRWGWDAREHEFSGGKAFPENSWRAGFDRMLLSYAMDADPAIPYQLGDDDAVFPVPGFDGGRAELLGKFIGLTAKLHEIAQTMRRQEEKGAPFREWESMLTESAGYLFGRESELVNLLLSILNTWQKTLADAGAEDVPLTSGIVLAYLQDKHAKPEDNTRGFMRGKITFCGLRPMRSIPADAILLLGMNHRVFPEQDDGMEFDLMQQYRKKKDSGVGREPGDPLRRDESRQLFLDTILAARKYLYISYVGRDIHDRKEKPPSVCVDELRNYLIQEFGENSFVELKEPLHSFSPELFRDGAANQSFSGKMRDAARQIAGLSDAGAASGRTAGKPVFDIRGGVHPDEQAQPDLLCRSVELDELRWFFADPAGKYVRDRLDASLSVRETSSPEDSEPFENALDWGVKDELFRAYLEAPDRDLLKDRSLRRLKADGNVPLMQNADDWKDWADIALIVQNMESCTGNMTAVPIPAGEMLLEYSAADIGDLAGLLYDPVPDESSRTTLVLPESKVYQPEEPDAPCVQLAWSLLGKLSGAQLIGPILNHLRANLVRKTETRIVFLEKDRPVFVKTDAMDADAAKNILKRFLCLYHAGMRKPLPFFPKTSYAYFEEQDEAGKAQAADAAWNGSQNSRGDIEKFGDYFGTELPASDAFKALAEAFFGAVVFQRVSQGERKRKK